MNQWEWDFDDEPPANQWQAVKVFGLFALFLSAVLVALAFWLLVHALINPEPYQDPEFGGSDRLTRLTYAPGRIIGP